MTLAPGFPAGYRYFPGRDAGRTATFVAMVYPWGMRARVLLQSLEDARLQRCGVRDGRVKVRAGMQGVELVLLQGVLLHA